MKLQTLKPRIQTAGSQLAVMQPGSWRTDQQTSTQRGYGYKWQQARAGFLAKHPFCAYCRRDAGIQADDLAGVVIECNEKCIAPPAYATVVDHIDPHRGDMKLFWNSSRWQSLCAHHHSADKQREEARAGWLPKKQDDA